MLKIGIIEDSTIYQEWLSAILAVGDDFKVISIDHSGRSGMLSIKQHQPDLVLLDFQLQDMTGLEVANRIKIYSNQVKVVVLTAHTHPAIIDRLVLDKNIDGILVKNSEYFASNFVHAIKLIGAGGYYIEPSILSKLRESKSMPALSDLTKREFEVFIQMKSSKPDQLIADDLCVDIAHVRNMKSRIIKKVKNVKFLSLVADLKNN